MLYNAKQLYWRYFVIFANACYFCFVLLSCVFCLFIFIFCLSVYLLIKRINSYSNNSWLTFTQFFHGYLSIVIWDRMRNILKYKHALSARTVSFLISIKLSTQQVLSTLWYVKSGFSTEIKTPNLVRFPCQVCFNQWWRPNGLLEATDNEIRGTKRPESLQMPMGKLVLYVISFYLLLS